MIKKGLLHSTILKHIIDKGFAPGIHTLAEILKTDIADITNGLRDLQEHHGVVLHPDQQKIWIIHPFSLAPTNFLVRASTGTWWGNCAWCSLGIAALIKKDLTITTTLGAYDKQVVIHIRNGKVEEKSLLVHFPVPMKNAWDNIMYTCSNMLVFDSEEQVDRWSIRHDIAKGDIQTVENIWEFSKKWYGNHLSANWRKWTMEDAKKIFHEFNLTHPVWDLEASSARF